MATIGISLSDVNTVAEGPAFRLGTRGVVETDDGTKEYVYVQNGPTTACIIGAVVVGYGTANVVAVTTDALGALTKGSRVGVAPVAVPINNYFWMQVYGRASVYVLASFAAGATPYVTATAGAVDDAATAGLEAVMGMFIAVAQGGVAGLNASATLTYPAIGLTA